MNEESQQPGIQAPRSVNLPSKGGPEVRFAQAGNAVAGRYLDYFIIVRDLDGNLTWRYGDKTWAIGACLRYINWADEKDRMEKRGR